MSFMPLVFSKDILRFDVTYSLEEDIKEHTIVTRSNRKNEEYVFKNGLSLQYEISSMFSITNLGRIYLYNCETKERTIWGKPCKLPELFIKLIQSAYSAPVNLDTREEDDPGFSLSDVREIYKQLEYIKSTLPKILIQDSDMSIILTTLAGAIYCILEDMLEIELIRRRKKYNVGLLTDYKYKDNNIFNIDIINETVASFIKTSYSRDRDDRYPIHILRNGHGNAEYRAGIYWLRHECGCDTCRDYGIDDGVFDEIVKIDKSVILRTEPFNIVKCYYPSNCICKSLFKRKYCSCLDMCYKDYRRQSIANYSNVFDKTFISVII